MCTVLAAGAIYSAAGYGAASYAGATGAALYAATAVAAAQGMQQGANIEAAEYNEDVAKNNAQTLEQQATLERQAGAQEAGQATVKTRQATSRAVAQMGASGTDIATGTNLDLLAQNEQMGAVDSLTIINNSNRRALGYEQEAINTVTAAKQKTGTAKRGAAMSLLSTVGTAGIGTI